MFNSGGKLKMLRIERLPGRLLEVSRVSKRFGDVDILRTVTFSIPAGAITVLLAPSGEGKSTLAEIIAGIQTPDSGQILIDNLDITRSKADQRAIALAPQEWELFPHLSAMENVAFGLWARGATLEHRHSVATFWLDRIGLKGRSTARPNQLSGGQQQRVALARALAVPGSFAILDEPFANVDQDTREILRRVVKEEATNGKGLLLITHDRNDALLLADTVVCLSRRQVAQIGTPEDVYRYPASLEVAGLTGEASFVPAALFYRPFEFGVPGRDDPPLMGCASSGRAGPTQSQGAIVRPEWIDVVDGDYFHLQGEVSGVDFLGSRYLWTVDLGGTTIAVDARSGVALGSGVRLAIRHAMTAQGPMTPQLGGTQPSETGQ
jgi:ABC-type Fe3+/spermidine/putrescine transport system ATPase subunit